MSARLYRKRKRFIGIPYYVGASEEFCDLMAAETKLLVDLLVQYTGRNNGTLTPAHALL